MRKNMKTSGIAILTLLSFLTLPGLASAGSATKLVPKLKRDCAAFTNEQSMLDLLEAEQNRENSYDEFVDAAFLARKAKQSGNETAIAQFCQGAQGKVHQLFVAHGINIQKLNSKIFKVQPAAQALGEKECAESLISVQSGLATERENSTRLDSESCGGPAPSSGPSVR